MQARAWLWWASALGAACGARELDPAACAARFAVQRDHIIRTEESRDMGARYLAELDVGAMPECLRLCCETEACDVFVYEEKGPGSCYLFACGPPEDFRCKFTAHGNFSSGVLALGRRQAELQDRERLALASLRSGSSAPPPSQRSPPAPPPPPAGTPRPPHPDLLLTHSGRCSRYQFECVRGGECVAVYNACDGVPQCADGSDEAPELGCPPPPTAPPPPPPPAPPRTTPPTPFQESVEQLGASEALELPVGAGVGTGSGVGGARERWPHRLAQVQPQHRYSEPEPSSHIFSHKGGLLQEAPPPPAPYPPFEPPPPPPPAPAPAPVPWPRRTWTQHQSMESMGGWGEGDPRLEWGERAWAVPRPRPDPEAMYVPARVMEPLQVGGGGGGGGAAYSGAGTLRDSAKKGPPPEPPRPAPARPSAPAPPAPPPPPPPPQPRRQSADQPQAHEDKQVSQRVAAGSRGAGAVEAGAVEAAGGLSEHPPAAVLLLVLGMAMTVTLGGMLGCRAGAARRRLRRGKPLAHDADYLVNGMYL